MGTCNKYHIEQRQMMKYLALHISGQKRHSPRMSKLAFTIMREKVRRFELSMKIVKIVQKEI